MSTLSRVGRDDVMGRELYLLELGSAEEMPESIELPSLHAACLIAWDAGGVAAETIGRVAERLLASGVVYVCAWGPDCERVHAVVDERVAARGEEGAGVLTTSHEDESLAETLWFLLNATLPGTRYVETCGTALVVVVGSADWASEARAALEKPADAGQAVYVEKKERRRREEPRPEEAG